MLHSALALALALGTTCASSAASGATLSTSRAGLSGSGAVKIWPTPRTVLYGDSVLALTSRPAWTILGPGGEGIVAGPVLRRAITRCHDRLWGAVSVLPPAAAESGARFVLSLASYEEELNGPVDESYSLNVTSAGVALSAPTVWGARHALDSLAQLATPATLGAAALRHAVVDDAPQNSYRGLMVSPGQRFMTPGLLLTTLDGMELSRLNVMHFHLSEFCRYAIESRAYPELSKPLEAGLNEGYYTWEEITDLVAQAKQRGTCVCFQALCSYSMYAR